MTTYVPDALAPDNGRSVLGLADLAAFFETHAKALGPYGISVALLLAASADDAGRVEMSYQQICESLAISRRQAVLVTTALVEAGLVRQERSGTKPSVWWVLSDAYAPHAPVGRVG